MLSPLWKFASVFRYSSFDLWWYNFQIQTMEDKTKLMRYGKAYNFGPNITNKRRKHCFITKLTFSSYVFFFIFCGRSSLFISFFVSHPSTSELLPVSTEACCCGWCACQRFKNSLYSTQPWQKDENGYNYLVISSRRLATMTTETNNWERRS